MLLTAPTENGRALRPLHEQDALCLSECSSTMRRRAAWDLRPCSTPSDSPTSGAPACCPSLRRPSSRPSARTSSAATARAWRTTRSSGSAVRPPPHTASDHLPIPLRRPIQPPTHPPPPSPRLPSARTGNRGPPPVPVPVELVPGALALMLESRADPLLVIVAAQELLQARRAPAHPALALGPRPLRAMCSACAPGASHPKRKALHMLRISPPRFLQLPSITNTMRRDALLATAMAHCSAGRAHINRGEVAAGCDCLSAALAALGAAGRPALAPGLVAEVSGALDSLVPAQILEQMARRPRHAKPQLERGPGREPPAHARRRQPVGSEASFLPPCPSRCASSPSVLPFPQSAPSTPESAKVRQAAYERAVPLLKRAESGGLEARRPSAPPLCTFPPCHPSPRSPQPRLAPRRAGAEHSYPVNAPFSSLPSLPAPPPPPPAARRRLSREASRPVHGGGGGGGGGVAGRGEARDQGGGQVGGMPAPGRPRAHRQRCGDPCPAPPRPLP